jgi:NADH-quinone oxidoreductase subunit E
MGEGLSDLPCWRRLKPFKRKNVDKENESGTPFSVAEVLKLFRRNHREDLIPCMQRIQDQAGYMSEPTIAMIAEHFDLPATKVYGIATFYDYFTFHPLEGEMVKICHGTACHMQGASRVEQEARKVTQQLEQKSRVRFLFKQCECQGACNAGPILQINEEIFTQVKPETVQQLFYKAIGKGLHHE